MDSRRAVSLALALFGCSRAEPQRAPADAGTLGAPPSTSADASPGRASVEKQARPYVPKDRDAFELLLRHNREVADLNDPLRLALAHVPERRPTWTKLPAELTGAFPGAPRFTVRAYAYGYRADVPVVAGCSPKLGRFEDGAMPIAEDGALCPSVAWPGALLTQEQASRLVGVVRSRGRDEEKRRTKCGFDPHHAFVFFGESGAPVATLLVCFKCNQWRSYPAQPGLDLTLGTRARDALSALCRELGLGGCGYDMATMDRIDAERARWWEHQQSEGDMDTGAPEAPGPRAPFLEVSSGVDPDKSVAEAARVESDRRRLCAWSLRRPAPKDRSCLDGGRLPGADFSECLATFPSCAAPVWRAEACVRAATDAPCTPPAALPACEGVAQCRWGGRHAGTTP